MALCKMKRLRKQVVNSVSALILTQLGINPIFVFTRIRPGVRSLTEVPEGDAEGVNTDSFPRLVPFIHVIQVRNCAEAVMTYEDAASRS